MPYRHGRTHWQQTVTIHVADTTTSRSTWMTPNPRDSPDRESARP
jgi:hypothetical protein